jgi:hypothetical protein
MRELERIRKEAVVAYRGICLEGLRGTTEHITQTAGVPVSIRTKNLQNTNQDLYLLR